MNFDLNHSERKILLEKTIEHLEHFYENTEKLATAPELDLEKIRSLSQLDFSTNRTPDEIIQLVVRCMQDYTVHTPHPSYFGLFNPRANFAGILGDLITAYFNPQLAAWSHAPFAAEVERHLTHSLGRKFGLPIDQIDGVFTTAGAEANHTALLCALHHRFPLFGTDGLRSCERQPVLYCSEQSHHSIVKAARLCGLGKSSVRAITSNDHGQMDLNILTSKIQEDRHNHLEPFMVTGTAGTTGIGAIDDLPKLKQIADEFSLWFHMDAAFGGAVCLSQKWRHLLNGSEYADSITFDAHKWMSVPMGAGMFFTSHPDILSRTFSTANEYMPKDAGDMQIVDPFDHSIQWSRRFIGLKLYMSLLFFGWKGYEKTIDHHIEIGQQLRSLLVENGWEITNQTDLPIVCFRDPNLSNDQTEQLAQRIVKSGKAWISSYPIQNTTSLRACITNYATQTGHLKNLITELNLHRKNILHT